ncbi:MAG: two-component regulator propeller domain-containing protein [Saprospiraceae bacterium]
MKTLHLFIIFLFCSFIMSGQDNLANHFIGISNTPINDILLEKNNNLLIATEQGLYRLRGFNVDANQVSQQAVHKIGLDEDDRVWAGLYSNQIASVKNGETYSTGINNNNIITAMLVEDNKVWIGTNDGLYMLSLKQMKEMPHYRRENSKLVSNQIMDLEVDEKGRLWIATDRGISIFDGKKWETLQEDKQVSAMARNGNNMWAAVERTIQQYGEDQKWRAVAMPLNYSGQPIRDLKFDFRNNLWVATNNVLKYDTQSGVFSVFDYNTGFSSTMALCIEIDNDNQVWIGTGGSGLFRINNTPLEQPMAANPPLKGFVEKTIEEVGTIDEIEAAKPEKTPNPKVKKEPKAKKERKRKGFNNTAIASNGGTNKEELTTKGSEKVRKSRNKPKTQLATLPKEYGKEKSNINFLGNRLIKEGLEIDVKEMTIEIAIWDGQNTDGDTVSLYYNGECILKEFSLTKERQYFTLDINPRNVNNLVLYAHSQGMLGYTTATIAIEGKDKPKEWVVLNSDLKKCDKITFNFVY